MFTPCSDWAGLAKRKVYNENIVPSDCRAPSVPAIGPSSRSEDETPFRPSSQIHGPDPLDGWRLSLKHFPRLSARTSHWPRRAPGGARLWPAGIGCAAAPAPHRPGPPSGSLGAIGTAGVPAVVGP